MSSICEFQPLTASHVPSCCTCGIVVTDDVKALQCDRCPNRDIWKCAQSLNLTNDLYDSLTSDGVGSATVAINR